MAYNEASASKVSHPTITSALEDIDSVLERLKSYVERAEAINAHLNGPRPTEVAGNTKIASPPNSVISSIYERRSSLAHLADRLESAITSIESSL